MKYFTIMMGLAFLGACGGEETDEAKGSGEAIKIDSMYIRVNTNTTYEAWGEQGDLVEYYAGYNCFYESDDSFSEEFANNSLDETCYDCDNFSFVSFTGSEVTFDEGADNEGGGIPDHEVEAGCDDGVRGYGYNQSTGDVYVQTISGWEWKLIGDDYITASGTTWICESISGSIVNCSYTATNSSGTIEISGLSL